MWTCSVHSTGNGKYTSVGTLTWLVPGKVFEYGRVVITWCGDSLRYEGEGEIDMGREKGDRKKNI